MPADLLNHIEKDTGISGFAKVQTASLLVPGLKLRQLPGAETE